MYSNGATAGSRAIYATGMLKVKGCGDAYWETGTEGVFWAILDQEKPEYDGLYILKPGDRLTIFDRSDTSKVLWSGVVDLEYESKQQHAIHNPSYVGQAVFNHWVHGLQRGLDAETWADYFFAGNPMKMERACGWESFRPDPELNVYHRGSLEAMDVADRQEVAMLSVKYARFAARGKARFFYKQTTEALMYLTLQDLRNLRDACDALLIANSDKPPNA